MSSRNELVRARARLQFVAPISDGVNLTQLQEKVATYIEQCPPSNEEVSFAWQAVVREFFGHVARKQSRSKASRHYRSKPSDL